jgi:hypothetical protein
MDGQRSASFHKYIDILGNVHCPLHSGGFAPTAPKGRTPKRGDWRASSVGTYGDGKMNIRTDERPAALYLRLESADGTHKKGSGGEKIQTDPKREAPFGEETS